MAELAGKKALVVGGSRGIGAGAASGLASNGADVAITYSGSKDKAHSVVRDIEASGVRGAALPLDGMDADSARVAVDEAADRLGGLDILVNCAGIFPYGLIEDVTLEQFDQAIAVHVRTAFLTTQAAVRHMSGGGRIIHIGTSFVERVPFPGVSLYTLSKSGLTGFAKALARELGPRGITVNVVHPGPTDTDMNPADSEGADGQRAITALGHYGVVEDIANTVVHLSGAGGRHITGASIPVDGGWAA
ncbi:MULTISPECIES: SDR family NAD(P)-dependent oxidoreductase [unclassified Saccharopolyspora]|uniref:SDR family NAD(P)-dependent oxidoreductase n=1 Tax=Saccharopolyspora TaxID=1835 RepID=UPI00190D8458|nr:SDR family oxidoreductase [Saccharopolyspora sp. HNM0986]MBK0870012.1 SDR family oxidoreductase [Saccharopolyspora sp. HNM0986]